LPRLVPPHTGLHLSQSFTITPRALQALRPAVRAAVVDSFVRSLHVVFMVGIPLAGLALVCALVLNDAPLHDTVTNEPGRAGPVGAVGDPPAANGAPVVAPGGNGAPVAAPSGSRAGRS
jgi:hypothetical protein